MKRIILVLISVLPFVACKQHEENLDKATTQEIQVSNSYLTRVEPPNWWIGMKDNSLQLLVYEENIGNSTPEISYTGISIENVHKADSPNYLFIDLIISETAKAGKFDIIFKNENGNTKMHSYELKERLKPAEDYVGFNSSDVIYLITPDRFANANPDNDTFENLKEKAINREED